MTTLIIKVDDERIESLKRILQEIPYVHEIEEVRTSYQLQNTNSTYEKIKKIQEEIGDQDLYEDIKDPSAWQRQIRKEWDRDF